MIIRLLKWEIRMIDKAIERLDLMAEEAAFNLKHYPKEEEKA